MSDSLRPHGLKHTRLPHPSLSPGACSNSCPLLVIPSSHLILCCPPLLLPSIVLSIRVFSNESALHIRWPKYWSFSFSISSSIEYSRLTSFRTDWFDLLAVQGTLKSLPQHHSLKASMHWCSALFMVQLSHDCWKNHSFDYTDLSQQSVFLSFTSSVILYNTLKVPGSQFSHLKEGETVMQDPTELLRKFNN